MQYTVRQRGQAGLWPNVYTVRVHPLKFAVGGDDDAARGRALTVNAHHSKVTFDVLPALVHFLIYTRQCRTATSAAIQASRGPPRPTNPWRRQQEGQ